MQAVVMAAGRGSRLGNLTKEIPKAFLEIKGYKMIEYNIAMLHSFGISDIIIVTGYQSEKFEAFTNDIKGVRCIFNPFYELVNVLGSFYMAQDSIDGDFVYLHADTLCDPIILDTMLKAEGDMILPVDFRSCDEEAMKVKTFNGRVTEISKNIPCQSAEGEFIGITKIRGNVLSDLRQAAKDLMKEKKFGSYFEGAIQRIIDLQKYQVIAIPTEDYFWGEVDFMEDYQKVKENIQDTLVQLTKGEFF